MGVVTEYAFTNMIGRIFRNGIGRDTSIIWHSAVGFLHPEDALVFLDNQDLQRNKTNISEWSIA